MSRMSNKLNRSFTRSALKGTFGSRTPLGRLLAVLTLLILTAAFSLDVSAQTTFESPAFAVGTVHNQNGWKSLGGAGLGCATYDHVINTNNVFAPVSFGAQSLRISNAVTSGCFHDGTFSASLANEAGETSAVNDGQSGGTRQNHFEYEFSIASAEPNAQQPGMVMSVAPDRGDGARMSYLRFEDQADGIHVIFDDFIDAAPFGGAVGDTAGGCGVEDDFTDIDIATLTRNAPHTIKFVMDFFDGPRNDVVKIYIDGVLVKTGTSWEDYFRYCEGQPTRTVDSMLFRTGGPAVPANAGKGFLIDNPSSASSSAYVVDDDGTGSAADCNDGTPAYSTIQSAATAALPGSTVRVCAGTYPEYVSTNKNLTFLGPQAGVDARTGRTLPANEAVVGNSSGAFNLQVNPGTTVIDGFSMTGANSTGDRPALLLIGGSGHQIVNNIIEGNNRGAFYTTLNATFKHNRLNNALDGFFGGGDGITIEENLFTGGHPSGAVNTTNFPQSNNYKIINNVSTSGGNFAVMFNTNNGQVAGNSVTNASLTAVFIGGGNSNLLIANNTFTGGTASAVGFSGGFGYPADSGVTVNGNAFVNNLRAVNVGTGANTTTGIEVHYNRIVGNTTGINNVSTAAVNAENNWWGCNYGPSSSGAGCSALTNGVAGSSAASVDIAPWLTLTSSAAPVSIGVGGTSNVTSRLTVNSASAETSGGGSVPNNTSASFAATGGTVAPPVNTTVSGVTSTVFTAASSGPGSVSTTVDGQTVSTAVNVNQPCVAVSIPSSTTLRNVPVTVPVNTGDVTGRGVISFDFTLTYNPSVLSYTGVSETGTVSSGMQITVNSSTPGTLIISGFYPGAGQMTGSGSLLDINFTSTGAIGTSSPLNLPAFSYNEDNPCTTTAGGTMTVVSGAITGTVSYLNSAAFRAVENTLLSGAGTPNVSTSSIADGTYNLSGMGNSAYVVTPSKAADASSVAAIAAFDASRIAQHVVSISPFPAGGGAALSADVSGNGTITSFDAAMVARYVASLSGAGSTGTWRFVPVNRSYTLAQVQTGVTGQDYAAILMGDVTGNWNGPINPTRQSEDVRDEELIRVDAPKLSANPGAEVIVPVTLANLNRKDIIAYQFELAYSPKVIRPAANACDVLGTVSKDLTVTCNAETVGLLKVVVFGASNLDGDGVLLNLRFNAVGSAGSVSPLTFKGLLFNEGEPQTRSNDGEVTITDPSGNSDSIGGRLLTSKGEAVAGTEVILTDSRGQVRSVFTSDAGGFSFGKLTAGETYVLSVSSKAYVFTPQTVSAMDGLVELTVIAEP